MHSLNDSPANVNGNAHEEDCAFANPTLIVTPLAFDDVPSGEVTSAWIATDATMTTTSDDEIAMTVTSQVHAQSHRCVTSSAGARIVNL
mmetsp:Transcript_9096/g.20678  ORF Transcript_9096/g.20678 Transcript_9096/m.20678 type:complete len:89 (+) Transcript_9096:272-538(+)